MQQTKINLTQQNQQKTVNDVFETDYRTILNAIDQIDPVAYARSRNYLGGQVTRLSPYISRGVISTNLVMKKLFEKGYRFYEMETLLKELCWRDYFQRTAQVRNLLTDIRQEQSDVRHHAIPENIVNASTGIEAIDSSIQQLYNTGYMHNHTRMYTAFMTCNLGKSHWLNPARWMYHHLLDGDWASNACSWQWVAGANSSKKYYANQDNINKYTGSLQKNTFLDRSYEELMEAKIPHELTETVSLSLSTILPETDIVQWDESLPAFIYNYHNLDPLWHAEVKGNRVLLLDPEFFSQYPVSENCISFLLNLSKNINGIQVFKGSFAELMNSFHASDYHYKEHPLNAGYRGTEEPRDWMAPNVTGFYPSFFAYWKKASKVLVR